VEPQWHAEGFRFAAPAVPSVRLPLVRSLHPGRHLLDCLGCSPLTTSAFARAYGAGAGVRVLTIVGARMPQNLWLRRAGDGPGNVLPEPQGHPVVSTTRSGVVFSSRAFP
jgi:hypothetical protein